MVNIMLLTDKKEFSIALRKLMLVYGRNSDPEVFSTWWQIFERYELSEVNSAFLAFAENESVYIPLPKDVKKYIASNGRDPTAEEAWDYVPKSESQSSYVTKRMMRALGVAEELIVMGDMLGARISFIRTYEDLPADNIFQYSGGYGVAEEEKLRVKVESYKLLKAKQWVSQEQQTTIEKQLTNQMNEAKRISSELEGSSSNQVLTKQSQDTKNQSQQPATETGLPPINRELNKKRVEELRSTMRTMPLLNHKDTGKD